MVGVLLLSPLFLPTVLWPTHPHTIITSMFQRSLCGVVVGKLLQTVVVLDHTWGAVPYRKVLGWSSPLLDRLPVSVLWVGVGLTVPFSLEPFRVLSRSEPPTPLCVCVSTRKKNDTQFQCLRKGIPLVFLYVRLEQSTVKLRIFRSDDVTRTLKSMDGGPRVIVHQSKKDWHPTTQSILVI